jgi:glucose-6-phosphate 1-epimerase
MIAAAADLDARWGRSGSVMFGEQFGGPVAVLYAAGASAVIAIQGAQVLSWIPNDAAEALWLSPSAQLGTGKAVRGGIPICWPWFGPHPDDAAKPAHGFVRAAPWQVTGSAASHDRARLVLGFDATRIDPALWPHRAFAEVEITLDQNLTVALTTANTGSTPFALTQALHSYFAVDDIADVAVTGLAGRRYIDQLDHSTRPVATGEIHIKGEIDRIYQATAEDVVLIDPSLGCRIRVAKTGSLSTVVWNPGPDKAAHLGDMGVDGHRRMVCIETANAGDDVVTLAPGARHRLFAKFSIEQL